MAIANHNRTSIVHIGGNGYGGVDIVTGTFNFVTTDTGGELPLPGRQVLHSSFTPLSDTASDEQVNISGETTSGGLTAIPSNTGTVTLLRTGLSPTSGAVYSYVAFVRGAIA